MEWTPREPIRPNHLLHLILTLVTCGLWLLVWLLVALKYEHQLSEWNLEMNRIHGTLNRKYHQ